MDVGDAIEHVRALAGRGEATLATIEAIRLLGTASDPAHEAAVLNDLAVLRFNADDLEAATGCLRRALELVPDADVARDNLAALQAELARRPPRRGAMDGLDISPSNVSQWVAQALAVAEEAVGLRDREVVEVGGAVPPEAVAQTGATRWVGCDPGLRDATLDDVSETRHADAAALPFEDASFDVAFSSCAFEHFADLDGALAEIRRVLQPGGALFTQFSPIWPCAIGHHLILEESPRGRLSFNDPVVPPWSHLLLEPDELRRFLALSLGGRADAAVTYIYANPYLNRLFDGDYRAAFATCGLEARRVEPWGTPGRPAPELRRALEARWPDRGRFDIPGYRAVFVKLG